MDSPRGVPEASSPVVLLPATTQFSYSIASTQIPTGIAARTSPRHPGLNYQPCTRRMAVTAAVSAIRTNNSFSVGLGAHDDDTAVAGPAMRLRKRAQNSTREKPAETTAVPPAASAPSRKRKAPSSASKASRSKSSKKLSNRKKPPPGAGLKEPPPVATVDGKSDENDDAADKKPAAVVENCCICMCDVAPNDLALINSCDHRFCFGCIEKWSERENKCPLCKTRFTKIDRVHKKRKKGTKNTKRVKQRDQRSDLAPGAALEGLIANLNRNSGSLARIIFGGFEFGGISGSGPPTARAAFSTTRTPSGVRAEFVDDEDDSDDDDSPMAAFMRALHGNSVANGVSMSTTMMRPMTVTAHFTTTTRSFARNVHDSTAGNGADNPLEIDDDSVDEIIEIE